jgi:selenocysteine-specific elongation factor
VEQNDSLDFFTGSAETPAQITLLDTDRLEPGGTAWAQLRLRDEVALAKGDRYIVRRPSPSLTIGGGQVVDPAPRRHKRFNEETLQALQTLQRGTPEELLLQALGSTPQDLKSAIEKSALEKEIARQAFSHLLADGQVIALTSDPQSPILISAAGYEEVMRRIRTLLTHYHHHQPLRRGMSKEELRSRLSSVVAPRAFPHLMEQAVSRGAVAEDATTYRLPQHEPTYTPAQQRLVDTLRRALAASPYSPPSPADTGADPEVIASLVDSGELVKLEETLYYSRATYDEMVARVLQTIDEQGDINVAAMRDIFGTTRKYAIPLLEHLDDQKITRRVGDVRVRW